MNVNVHAMFKYHACILSLIYSYAKYAHDLSHINANII